MKRRAGPAKVDAPDPGEALVAGFLDFRERRRRRLTPVLRSVAKLDEDGAFSVKQERVEADQFPDLVSLFRPGKRLRVRAIMQETHERRHGAPLDRAAIARVLVAVAAERTAFGDLPRQRRARERRRAVALARVEDALGALRPALRRDGGADDALSSKVVAWLAELRAAARRRIVSRPDRKPRLCYHGKGYHERQLVRLGFNRAAARFLLLNLSAL